MSLFAIYIVQTYGTGLELRILNTKLRESLLNEAAHLSRLRYSAQVTLHVGHEAGHTSLTECLGHHLQRHRLTRTRGTGYESVAVRHLSCNTQRPIGAMGYI